MAYLGLAISFAFTPIMLGYFKATVRRNPYILMFGCVLQLFGGGITVLFATLYAVAADVSSDQDKSVSPRISWYAQLTRLVEPQAFCI